MSQVSEIETICFQHSPCGMLVMDKARSILELNETLASMLGSPLNRLLGKNREALQLPIYRTLLNGEGLKHIPGPGIEKEKWLFCTEFEGETRIIRFYLDVTEQEKLKQEVNDLHRQVEDLTITDELTGLANPRALNRALNSQVTRSRRYNNPLCLAVMELVDEKNSQATLGDEAILFASRHLRDRLRWVDTIARWDHNHFVVILPETNAEDGHDLIEKISSGFSDVETPPPAAGSALKLRFGLAQWMKGNDSRMLMERAAQSLDAPVEEQLETATR